MTKETWFLWNDGAHRPTWNMSADDVLLTTAENRHTPVLRFYGWDRPAVTIGYVQTFNAVDKNNVEIVRRPTGGGVVDHENDFTYSVILPPDHWLTGVDRMESYHWINRAVGHGLAECGFTPTMAENNIPQHVDRMRMRCFQQPTRYDVLADDEKIAGSAQRRTRQGILHQGSVMLKTSDHAVNREQLHENIVAGFGEILGAAFTWFKPDSTFYENVEAREKERYTTPEWRQYR